MASYTYKPERCSYCDKETWCEIRANGKPQCRACKIVRFFEQILYAPLGYSLQAWQKEVLIDLYGTVDLETGRRCYRRSFVSVAKQNGKSFLLGGLPLFHMMAEYELQPQAFGVASARDQAGIVFDAARLLVEANPYLQKHLQVTASVKRIHKKDGNGAYAVLSAEGKVQDGKRPSLLLFDELHRFTKKGAEVVYSVLTKGMISRAEPLMIQTTTSGDQYECPLWWNEYEYAQHLIKGSIKSTKYYAKLYQANPKRIEDEEGYWKTREARVAANPSHEDNGGFLKDEAIVDELEQALAHPEKKTDYIRYHLNVPVSVGETPIMEMPIWYKGDGDIDMRTMPEYDVEYLISKWGLQGRPCAAAIDMAWTTDMAALALLFPPLEKPPVLEEGESGPLPMPVLKSSERWHCLMFYWLPEERVHVVENITRAPLATWVQQRFLETTPGATISPAAIFKKLNWAREMFDVREVTFDKWGSIKTACELLLVPEGVVCVQVPQTFAGLSASTKDFIGIYLNRGLVHGNNPILNWNASCLALATDGGDNCKPVKPARDSANKRIDGIAALITAHTRAQTIEQYSGAAVEIW